MGSNEPKRRKGNGGTNGGGRVSLQFGAKTAISEMKARVESFIVAATTEFEN